MLLHDFNDDAHYVEDNKNLQSICNKLSALNVTQIMIQTHFYKTTAKGENRKYVPTHYARVQI